MANKRIIARIDALLASVKQTMWYLQHPVPHKGGNAVADRRAARGFRAPCMSRSSSASLLPSARYQRLSKSRPPCRPSDPTLLRRTRGDRGSSRRDPRSLPSSV